VRAVAVSGCIAVDEQSLVVSSGITVGNPVTDHDVDARAILYDPLHHFGVDLSTGRWCRDICGKLSEFDTVSGVVMHSGEASVPVRGRRPQGQVGPIASRVIDTSTSVVGLPPYVPRVLNGCLDIPVLSQDEERGT